MIFADSNRQVVSLLAKKSAFSTLRKDKTTTCIKNGQFTIQRQLYPETAQPGLRFVVFVLTFFARSQ